MTLPQTLGIPVAPQGMVEIVLQAGQPSFVLGANGVGKSALLVKMAQMLGALGRRLIASRPIIIDSDSVEITPSQAMSLRSNMASWDATPAYRAKAPNLSQRAQLYLNALSELENQFARGVLATVRGPDDLDIPALRARQSPIERINGALAASGFEISIFLDANGSVQARKGASDPFGVSNLSDGERAALILLIELLYIPDGSVMLVDEPERHIHRALLLPLVKELVALRPDCSLIVATHDIELPMAFPNVPVALLRGMTEFGERWIIDVVPGAREIPFDIRDAILGSRRRLLFVEGEEGGLDHGLYNILISNISAIARGNSREVEQAVHGARGLEEFEWLHAWGIIDRDGRTSEQMDQLKLDGIWCIPVYSVESVYYHPTVVGEMSRRSADLIGGNAEALLTQAQILACQAAENHIERLARRAVEKKVRAAVFAALPSWQELSESEEVIVPLNPRQLYDDEKETLARAIAGFNWEYVVERCPIRETPALHAVATAIGFQSPNLYESAVRKALADDIEFRLQVLQLLGEPPSGLDLVVS
jgi:hypothetical protein